MSHAIYCDRCGRESRSDVEPHEEQNIRPGPVEGRDLFHNLSSPREIEFIRLGEHRETTGDRIWCEPCWNKVTASEVSPYWRQAFVDAPWRLRRKHILWQKSRCLKCRQWLEVCIDCPLVETTRYTLLLETAGDPINGWFYGVLFQDGKAIDVRCPKHMVNGSIYYHEHLRPY